jgi:hypothetical protein
LHFAPGPVHRDRTRYWSGIRSGRSPKKRNVGKETDSCTFTKGFLGIAQVSSYIPGGAWSFWKFIGLLLSVVGFAIALLLIWVALRWAAKKLAATFRKK